MSHICSQNADVAYLFRPRSFFFTDKVSQYRPRTRLLKHWLVFLFILIINESQADGGRKALGSATPATRLVASAGPTSGISSSSLLVLHQPA